MPDKISSYGIPLICSFCGGQQFSAERCGGCGAASLLQSNSERKPAVKVKKAIDSRSYLVHFGIAVAAGALVSLWSASEPTLPTESGVKHSVEAAWVLPVPDIKPVRYSVEDIKHKLAGITDEYDFHYVGLTEPGSASRPVVLNLHRSHKKLVLILSSHKSIDWVLSNPHDVDIHSVVYGSTIGVSTVRGDVSSVQLINSVGRIGDLAKAKDCECVASGFFHCLGNEIGATVSAVESLGGGKLTGVSNKRSAASIEVPEASVEHYLIGERRKMSESERSKNSCFNNTATSI